MSFWSAQRTMIRAWFKGKYMIIAQKSSSIQKGSLVQFRAVKMIKNTPKVEKMAPGGKRGWRPPVRYPFWTPVWRQGGQRRGAPFDPQHYLFWPSVLHLFWPPYEMVRQKTFLILGAFFDHFDHSDLYHTSFLHEIRLFSHHHHFSPEDPFNSHVHQNPHLGGSLLLVNG